MSRSFITRPAHNTEFNIFKDYVYLDNNGTTPPHASVIKKMSENAFLGNASSTYGNAAREEIAKTNNWICRALEIGNKDTQPVIIYTSGASESNNLFLRGVVDFYWLMEAKKGNDHSSIPNIILSDVEHKTSIECAKQLASLQRAEVTFIAPRVNGTIDPMEIAYAIKPNTVGISIMHVNNETGAINDVAQIAKIAASRGIPFHTDIAQSFGKIYHEICNPFANTVAMSISFHKLYGPVGVGALVVSRSMAEILANVPQICGNQNYGLRGGTENVAGIVGAGEAIKLSTFGRIIKNAELLGFKKHIINFIQSNFIVQKYEEYAGKPEQYDPFTQSVRRRPIVIFLGPVDFSGFPDLENSAPNTLLISFVRQIPLRDHFCNIILKEKLLEEGIIVSIGSACNTTEGQPSHVLTAMKAPYIVRCGVIRISFGDYNTLTDIKKFEQALLKHCW